MLQAPARGPLTRKHRFPRRASEISRREPKPPAVPSPTHHPALTTPPQSSPYPHEKTQKTFRKKSSRHTELTSLQAYLQAARSNSFPPRTLSTPRLCESFETDGSVTPHQEPAPFRSKKNVKQGCEDSPALSPQTPTFWRLGIHPGCSIFTPVPYYQRQGRKGR